MTSGSHIGEERNKLGSPDHSRARRSYRCIAGNLAMQRTFRRRTEVRIFIGVVARACKTQSCLIVSHLLDIDRA